MSTVQPLDRIAFEFGPFTVYWYGIIIGCGIFLGWWLASREAKKQGLPQDMFSNLLLWAVPISIVSARIYYVIFEWGYYSNNIGQIFQIWEGGIAIHGALIGAIITTFVFTRKHNVSFWKLADIAAPSIILGQAIGRWGNFMNQEAHGTEVSREFLEGLMLPEVIINQMYIEGTYFHPTFLYESLWNLLGFVLLISIRRLTIRNGELFLTYIIWYSFGRFFIEGMRTDSLMLTDSLRIAQIISIILIIVSTMLIFINRKRETTKKNT
ncbi:prolipoprotein diacylglyceryl transferase [Bacillus carboniphilus]|uniref:Phosphatidylglycerol--prolipoprotein diacylglyceryl transferase n=1 Tax=Bacillus carboniphilus TaxID=86663 RepID=A0ABP3FZZ4_9BACI